MTVDISEWGKDHWSTFAYIETRIVDYKGIPDREHMRVDTDLHPHFQNSASRSGSGKYPTRLKKGKTLENHDDWSCLDDCEVYGFLENIGTGMNRVYRLTEKGSHIATKLRKYKANGGQFKDFTICEEMIG